MAIVLVSVTTETEVAMVVVLVSVTTETEVAIAIVSVTTETEVVMAVALTIVVASVTTETEVVIAVVLTIVVHAVSDDGHRGGDSGAADVASAVELASIQGYLVVPRGGQGLGSVCRATRQPLLNTIMPPSPSL